MGERLLKKFHGVKPVIEITDRLEIPYEPKHERFGSAGFEVAQAYKRNGHAIEVYILRDQQERHDAWVIRHRITEPFEISFSSLAHLEPPRIWRTGYCAEVKGPYIHIYVPKDSHVLKVRKGPSWIGLDFA